MSWQQKAMLYSFTLTIGAMGITTGWGVANTPDQILQQLGMGFVMLVASTVPTLMLIMFAALDSGGTSEKQKLWILGNMGSYILGLWVGYLLLPLL